jgi:hypothetical protein
MPRCFWGAELIAVRSPVSRRLTNRHTDHRLTLPAFTWPNPISTRSCQLLRLLHPQPSNSSSPHLIGRRPPKNLEFQNHKSSSTSFHHGSSSVPSQPLPHRPRRRGWHRHQGPLANTPVPQPSSSEHGHLKPLQWPRGLPGRFPVDRLPRAQEGPPQPHDRLAGLVACRLWPLRRLLHPHGLALGRHVPHV